MTTVSQPASQTLKGAKDYFVYVLEPNKESFFGAPSTFATALNLASTLFHFHEWLFEEFSNTVTRTHFPFYVAPRSARNFLDRRRRAHLRRTPSRRPRGSMNFRGFAAVNGLRPPEAARA